MKRIFLRFVMLASLAFSALAQASEPALTAGEIRRVDATSGKLTIRHEEIKNLNMGAMTMVFTLKDKTLASSLKANDKVLFKAVDEKGQLMITHIEPAKDSK